MFGLRNRARSIMFRRDSKVGSTLCYLCVYRKITAPGEVGQPCQNLYSQGSDSWTRMPILVPEKFRMPQKTHPKEYNFHQDGFFGHPTILRASIQKLSPKAQFFFLFLCGCLACRMGSRMLPFGPMRRRMALGCKRCLL